MVLLVNKKQTLNFNFFIDTYFFKYYEIIFTIKTSIDNLSVYFFLIIRNYMQKQGVSS